MAAQDNITPGSTHWQDIGLMRTILVTQSLPGFGELFSNPLVKALLRFTILIVHLV
jgi:hypothetical protein